ncbi:MAG TPA: hypothetical protein VF727_07240 [Allosphingosinicella sp.]
MKRCLIVALAASQIAIAAAPAAAAADLDAASPFGDNRRGAFAGLRLRAGLNGPQLQMRAGLTLAPTAHSRLGANSRMAMGEGLELGISPGSKPTVTLAGDRLDRIALFDRPAQDRRANMSTLAKVAIVTGIVVIAGTLAFVHVMNEASCLNADSDC